MPATIKPPIPPRMGVEAARALIAKRKALADHAAQRAQMHQHRKTGRKLERQIAHFGLSLRTKGKLNAQGKAKLAAARAELDALNESIFEVRKKLLT